ncbi:MAG: hypothetical protein NZ658_08535, partial [Pirellulales bacterium]|nr:hypothetical protein [Pirellulales bacterium]
MIHVGRLSKPELLRGVLATVIVAAAGVVPGEESPMPVEAAADSAVPLCRPFGTLPDGREASLYTLTVPGGWQATVT